MKRCPQLLLLVLTRAPHGFVQNTKVKKSKRFANSRKALWIVPTLGTLLFQEFAWAQTGPIIWQNPNINWTPGATQQIYNKVGCPGNQNDVTITFTGDFDRSITGINPPGFPQDFSTEIGTGGGAARQILFTGMGNLPNTNPGFQKRDRQTNINITFTSPIILGNFFLADIDRAITGANNTRWVDEVVVTANNGAIIPNTTAGTSITGGTAVSVVGNIATGIADSPNANAQGDTAAGNVNVNFGPNLISSIEIIYRNDLDTSTGTDGNIASQAITIGDIGFANPCIGVAKEAGVATDLGGGVFSIPYTITVRNQGNVDLANVQVVENFAQQFGLALGTAPLQPGEYRVSTAPAAAVPLSANTNFNGSSDINLLNAGASTLTAGATQTVTLTVEVRPATVPALLNNQVTANANFTPPGGQPINVTDNSNNGTDPDPNNTGNPGGPGNDVPTRVALPPGSPIPPIIGVAKAAGAPQAVAGQPGVFDITYSLVVENSGTIDLNNVQVEENFAAAIQPGGAPDPIWSSLTYTTNTSPAVGQYTIVTPPTVGGNLTTANTGFTGSGTAPNINLLGAGNALTAGQSGTITFTARVRPNPTSLPGNLNNQVRASGTDPNGNTVEDRSVNGANPDADGNLDPRNDEGPTPVPLPAVGPPPAPPRIGVGKGVGLPRDVGNGVFEVPYTIRVQNYGGVNLTNVQVTEDFAAAITPPGTPDPGWSSLTYTPNANPSPGQYTVSRAPNATGTLTGSAAFTGSAGGSTDLLNAANSTLAVGQSETINFLVRVNPVNRPVTLNNQVRASGIDPNNPNTPVTDDSADDANNPGNPNPDPDLDGNPNNNTSPTPVQLPPAPTPRIGVGKSATNATDATPNDTTDGLFDISYEILVQNAGNVDLTNVQLSDDFASQFGLTYTSGTPGIGQYTIIAPPATAAPLTANSSFTGSGANAGLLNPAGSSLAVGQSQTLAVGVRVNINPANFPFILDNQVTATGSGGGQTVSDLSNDGAGANNPNPDPDGDGDPRNNNIPTRVSLPLGQPIPRIGTAKAIDTTRIVTLGDGRFNVPYTILVENSGTDNLNNVQVTENFEAADPLGFGLTYVSGTPGQGQYTVIGAPSTSNPLRINPTFTGSTGGSVNLLDAANSNLPVGQRREINFVVQVFPTTLPVTLNNQAQATGTGAQSGRGVTDDSVDGLNTSPDGDLNPNNNAGPTAVVLPPSGASTSGDFVLVKRITGVTRNGQAIPGLDFSRFVDDPSSTNDNTLNGTALTPVGLLDVQGLQSGDEVEYTVYYLAGGRQPVSNARVCDLVPERTKFIPNSFGGDSGILLRQGTAESAQTNAADGDRGQFFSPLAPVDSIIPPCPTNTTNPNGAVFVNLGDLPNAGPNQTGFLRFRVRLD